MRKYIIPTIEIGHFECEHALLTGSNLTIGGTTDHFDTRNFENWGDNEWGNEEWTTRDEK